MARPAVRETAQNLLLSAVTLLVFIGALEGVSRLVERRRPRAEEIAPYIVDWQDWDGEFYTIKSTAVGMPPWEDYNHEGLRDREHSLVKPDGVRRVVCLGDSTTLGWGIRPEQAYPQVLQDRLDAAGERAEVFNVGLGGWATRQELIAYRRIARKYRPDQVLLAICLNDVAEMQNNLARPPAIVGALHRRSALVRLLVRAPEREIRDVEELFEERDAPRVREGFTRMFADLRTLRDEALADGAAFALLIFPFALQVAPEAPPPTPQRTILEFCEAERIPCLDLLPALKAAGPDAFIDYDHFSPSGARRVAEQVLNWGLLGGEARSPDSEADPGGPTVLAAPAPAPSVRPVSELLAALRDARTDRERVAFVRSLGYRGASGREAVPALLPLLRDPSPDVRAATAWAIGGVNPTPERVLPGLIGCLGDDDPRTRAGAAWSLGKIGGEARPAAGPLIALLADPDPSVRWRAGDALAAIGPEPESALAPLLAVVDSQHDRGQAEAIEAIGRMGAAARRAVPALVRSLKDPRDEVRSRAVIALGHIGPEAQAAVPALRAALKDDPEVRWRAADALGEIGPGAAAAVPELLSALHDPASSVRWRAARALGTMGAAARVAAPDLVAVVEDPEVNVRVAAVGALSRVEAEPAATLPVLRRALRDADPRPRIEAVNALARMGAVARPAVPDLAELLKDPDAAVRGKAARALGRIGGLSPSVVHSLSALTNDEDERVRFEAKRALGRAALP